MKPRRLLAARDTAQIFDLAVQERALAVLTFQQGNDWLTFKSRFLERDHKGRFFVLDYQAPTNETLPDVSPGQYLGISFRQKNRKILFSTVVEARGHFCLDDQTTIPAVRYRWPNSMTELQRRAYYRTPVPDGMNLVVSLWKGGVTARVAAQSDACQVITGSLADVSCGGAMVRLHTVSPPEWVDDELLGLELQLPDGRTPIQLDARYRGTRHDEGEDLGTAVQFIGLEVTVDGRVVLQRLASAVQKLHRLSLAEERRDGKPRFRS